jgi:hypothetical protein
MNDFLFLFFIFIIIGGDTIVDVQLGSIDKWSKIENIIISLALNIQIYRLNCISLMSNVLFK